MVEWGEPSRVTAECKGTPDISLGSDEVMPTLCRDRHFFRNIPNGSGIGIGIGIGIEIRIGIGIGIGIGKGIGIGSHP